MGVLINYKICDNAEECGGLAACPTEAIFWDKNNETLKIDNTKCVSCGLCSKACELGAIEVAKTDEEYASLKKEIDADPRKLTDLFVDRYGAQTVLKTFLVNEKAFDPKKLKKINVVELFNDGSIQCLLKSIPISELLKGYEANYTRVRLDAKILTDSFDVKKLPSLLFFKGSELIGKVEGYYDINRQVELQKKIRDILGS